MASNNDLSRYIANYKEEITMHLSIIYVDCLQKVQLFTYFWDKLAKKIG